jgi:hypothetical protein
MSYREAKSTGRCSRKASTKPAPCSWIAAATSAMPTTACDAAVLHLLLDVRLPARRRSDLGRGRPALARLPARRHRRAHHAAAKACSTRTATASWWRHGAQLPRLRPGLRLRTRGDRRGWHARMYRAQEDVFYYITVMNENYAQPSAAAGSARRHRARHVPAQAGGKGKLRATLLGSGTILREVLAAAELLAGLRRRRRRVQRHQLQRTAPRRRATANAGTCCTPAGHRACRRVLDAAGRHRDLACGRRDRLRAQRAGADPPVGRTRRT